MWKEVLRSYMKKIVQIYNIGGLHDLLVKSVKRVNDFIAPKYAIVAVISRLLLRIQDRSSLESVANTYHYSTSERIEYQEPYNLEPIPEEFSHVFGEQKFEQPFVCEIQNGLILRKTGIRTMSDFSVILETVSGRRDSLENYLGKNMSYLIKLLSLQFLSNSNRPTNYDYECACPLMSIQKGSDGPGGFSGWVQDSLTKLEGVEYYRDRTGESPVIILEPDPPDYQIESLHALGYTEDDYTMWDGKEKHIKKLIIPTSRRPENNISYYKHRLIREYNREYVSIAPSACRWLRSAAEGRVETNNLGSFSGKIIISRSDASRRRIINQNKLVNSLKKEGFESYELSNLTFEETIKMFSQAEVVVGPHGAGLASTVFSHDCKIIEIFGYNIRPIFFMLSENINNDYGLVFGKPVEQDIIADVDDIKKIHSLMQDEMNDKSNTKY